MTTDWRGKPFYFEDFRVGDSHDTVSYTVGKDEIIAYASKWDPQPWHVDEDAAAASMFGGLTACSAHIFAIFCLVSPQWRNGAVQQPLASLGFDELRMLKPVYAGDTLTCISTVEVARASSSKADRGIVASRCVLHNQHGEPVFSLLASFLIARRG